MFLWGATGFASIQVDNFGTGTLIPTLVSVTGPQAAEFSIEFDDCSAQAIAPGMFCTIDLSFSPAAAGVRTATLRVDSNAPTGPVFVNLRGSNDVLFSDGFE